MRIKQTFYNLTESYDPSTMSWWLHFSCKLTIEDFTLKHVSKVRENKVTLMWHQCGITFSSDIVSPNPRKYLLLQTSSLRPITKMLYPWRHVKVVNVPLIHPTQRPWNSTQTRSYFLKLIWHHNQLPKPQITSLEIIWNRLATNLHGSSLYVACMWGTLVYGNSFLFCQGLMVPDSTEPSTSSTRSGDPLLHRVTGLGSSDIPANKPGFVSSTVPAFTVSYPGVILDNGKVSYPETHQIPVLIHIPWTSPASHPEHTQARHSDIPVFT